MKCVRLHFFFFFLFDERVNKQRLFIKVKLDEVWEAAESGCGERGGEGLGDSEGADEDPSGPSKLRELSALFPFQKVLCSHN